MGDYGSWWPSTEMKHALLDIPGVYVYTMPLCLFHPVLLRIGDKVGKGYKRESFSTAWPKVGYRPASDSGTL